MIVKVVTLESATTSRNMSLCRQTSVLTVVLVLCAFLLPTTLSFVFSAKTQEKEDGRDLADLLERLHERLKNQERAEHKHFKSLHDNFNEERSLFDEIRASELNSVEDHGNSRGTGLHEHANAVRQSQVPATTLTKDQQTKLVDEMNSKRRSVGAADMYKLHWNDKLAGLAQLWSSRCNYVHGYDPYNYNEYDYFSTLGANLWAYQGPFDAAAIVADWYSDKVNFNRLTQNCESDSTCGGYRQLVNSYTTDVGCGVSTCDTISSPTSTIKNANFIVCYFGPPGNYLDAATFTPGPACTLCKNGQFYCDNGLCDKTCTASGAGCECKASCKQCGTVTPDCRCQCNDGSYGVDCGQPCRDTIRRCGKAGYTDRQCQNPNLAHVKEMCPLTCGLCKQGNPCGDNSSGGDSNGGGGNNGGNNGGGDSNGDGGNNGGNNGGGDSNGDGGNNGGNNGGGDSNGDDGNTEPNDDGAYVYASDY